MQKIILISGSSYGAGKDTLADFIAEECKTKGLRPRIMRFGDWVKDALVRYYNWNGQKDEEGRKLLQYFATDEVRTADEDYWADVLCRLAKATKNDWDVLLVPDLRFPNEYFIATKYFNPRDISVVRVDRKTADNDSANRQHVSEHSMAKFTFDIIINNDGTLEELKNKATKLLDEILII